MSRPARVVIDLAAARHNLARARALAPGSRLLAVVKADGYGHGLLRMARAFAGCDALGVACVEEALELREAGVGGVICVLEGPYAAAELAAIAAHGLDVVVHHEAQLSMLEATPVPGLRVWLKIDTGMHRLGFAPAEAPRALDRLQALDTGEIVLMSHFANTDRPGHESVAEQTACFNAVAAGRALPQSLANSGAVLAWPEAHRDWIRPGLMLYGASPFAGGRGRDHGLVPVMGLHSELMAIRQLAPGDPVGYGGTWRAPERMLAGIAAIGYGDGYPRHADSGAPVLVGGCRSQVLGKASMDMLCVDLRPVAEPRLGMAVELWGDGLPVEEVATFAGTVPYELLCGVRQRMRWDVVGEGR